MESTPKTREPRHRLEQKLAAAWPPADWQAARALLAVSGGADSVALLRALCTLQISAPQILAAAHFNHRLQGAQADADEQFVVDQCRRLGIACHVGRPDAPTRSTGDGAEAAARAARYDFLRHTAELTGARYLVTAHTADDQAETILHHILRGTGLPGLAGMPRARPLGEAVTLIRPMLDTTRAEVLAYLAEIDQPYRNDATNADRQFTRNRIRHELLPLLARDFSPGVVQSLLRLGSLAADAQCVIDAQAGELLDRILVRNDLACAIISCGTLGAHDRHLVREALLALWRRQVWPLQAMGFSEWNLLADLALAKTSSGEPAPRPYVLPGAITARRHGDHLELRAAAEKET